MAESWKRRVGVVFSTDPGFQYDKEQEESSESVPPEQQHLQVQMDRKKRKGKTVTLVTGFQGPGDELRELGKRLKIKCGAGGSVKDREIVIQGDHRDLVMEILRNEGFHVKKKG
jgi:translation initiation factor 1